MNQPRQRVRFALLPLAVLASIAAPSIAPAQDYRARYRQQRIEPQPVHIRLRDIEFGTMAEGSFQQTEFLETGRTYRNDRLFIGPQLGLGMDGWIYHPSFIRFRLAGQGAYGRSDQTVKSDTREVNTDEWSVFGRFSGSLTVLPGKPLSGGAEAGYGRSYREYDFFTHTAVESRSYGVHLNYRESAYDGSVSYNHSEERMLDTEVPYSSRNDVVSMRAHRLRERGDTSFDSSVNRYNVSGAAAGSEATDYTVALADSARLGSREQAILQSQTSFTHRDSPEEQSDQWIAGESLQVEHSPILHSSYDLRYDRYDTGTYIGQNASGSASLSHQLYKSLLSSVSVHGIGSDAESESTSALSTSYGGSWGESYTKLLGRAHSLHLDHSLSYDWVHQPSANRAVNEQHTFPRPPEIESFFLNLSDAVESSVVVKDQARVREYIRGMDYEVFRYGYRTEIRRIPGGQIREGEAVLVDYSTETNAEGDYVSSRETAGIRLDLWRNLWSLYARMSTTRNNANSTLHVHEMRMYSYGTELRWERLRGIASREMYESDVNRHRSTRFSESYSFRPGALSSMSVHLSQAFIEYQDAGREETDYRYTARYSRTLTSRLSGSADAGFDVRRGEGVDQTLLVIRPEFHYRIGRTAIDFQYDYERNDYLDTERRLRHTFMLSLKRRF